MAPPAVGADPANTTLFIGGLSTAVVEEQLRAVFARFGDLIYTKVPQGKGCGFVQFVDRRAAEHAMQTMNGQVIGSNAIRISWGRSTNKSGGDRDRHPPPPQQGGHHAGGGQYGQHTQYHGYSGAYPSPYDPHAAAYPPPYAPAYDPYGAGAYHAAAAYPQAYGYGAPTASYPTDASGYPLPAAAAAAAVGAGAASAAASRPDAAKLAPSVDDLNAAYMQRHMPLLTGAHMRALVR